MSRYVVSKFRSIPQTHNNEQDSVSLLIINKTLSPCNHNAVILSNARQPFKHFSGFPFPCKKTFLRSAYH